MSSIKLNLIDLCCIVPCQYHGVWMPGRRGLGHLLQDMREYNAAEPKTGPQKVQFYCKDKIHCRSGYNLSMAKGYKHS